MNRMTVKRDDGRWAIANNDGSTIRQQFEKIPVAMARLAAYEDTGLEPEEIRALISLPNAPLTLDELREMAGEPVWFSCDFSQTYRWRVILSVTKEIVYFTDRGHGNAKDYGVTWLAYRRNQEEVRRE